MNCRNASYKVSVVATYIVSSFKQKLQEYWTDIGYGYVQRPGA